MILERRSGTRVPRRSEAWILPDLTPIDDPDDPRIADYRCVRERDLACRRGRFVAEGELVVRTLLSPRSRCSAESVLLSRRAARSGAAWLATVPADRPVFVAAQAVMDAIVGFPIHRGVLAIGRRPPETPAAVLLAACGPKALVLGLVGIANHDNVGGLFRNAAAFGCAGALLDPSTCDPLYRKAIRVSVGASLCVPFARGGNADELLPALEGHGFTVLALTPSGAEPIERVSRRGRTALLVGAEGHGLPERLLRRTRTIRIPMAPGFDSLNVATAAGIALHRLSGSS